ncbi:hypothetical protein JCM4914_67990 [Streptomyces platensis subsp. malvinus]
MVFLGLGDCGVVAGDPSGFPWVPADGCGPMEAVRYDHGPRDAALTALAERYATTPRRPAQRIAEEAEAEFPTFVADVDALAAEPLGSAPVRGAAPRKPSPLPLAPSSTPLTCNRVGPPMRLTRRCCCL